MRWTVIGSSLFCPVAVCRRPGEITLFARGATGELLSREWESGSWSDLHSLGLPVAHIEGSGLAVPSDWQGAAGSGGPTRVDVFAPKPHRALPHKTPGEGEGGAFECPW